MAAFLAVACLALSLVTACQTRRSPPQGKKVDAGRSKTPTPAGPDASPPPPGPYHVLAPLQDTAAFDACGDDTDCMVVALRCCDCAHGGLGVAVARAKAAGWPGASCADQAQPCEDTPTNDPTCRGTSRCLNGHCRLTVQAGQLSPAAPSPGSR